MPARALLVLLVMLNLGVATWWLLRPAAPPVPRKALPADVPRLQLLAERPVPAAPAATPPAEPAADDGIDAPDGGPAAVPGNATEDAPR